jgi:predicted phage terminase large subunit-like protein
MIIDDLIKNAQEAYNEQVLQKHIDWFNNTMLSRTETGFKLIVIMTRWASNDLAGYILENYDNVRHINYKAIQEDGTLLCEEILNKEDFELKTKNMNKDIVYANYQQEPIDVKNRLYSGFKIYEKLPPAHYIMNYTDTADEGNDYLCSIDYQMYMNDYYILDVIYTQEPMEVTEPAVANMLTKDNVGCANIESNNGGRGFARNVQTELKKLNNKHTKVNWFHQSENKIARILSNSTGVQNNIYFPINWKDKFPDFAKHILHYVRTGKNEHDDAEDCLTGVYENPKPKITMQMSNKQFIKR